MKELVYKGVSFEFFDDPLIVIDDHNGFEEEEEVSFYVRIPGNYSGMYFNYLEEVIDYIDRSMGSK